MKKHLYILMISSFIMMLSGCMPEKTLTYEQVQGLNDPIVGTFMVVDEEYIHIDITMPYVEYAEANNIGYEDFTKEVQIKRTELLEIVNTEGKSLDVKGLEEGDTIYLEYELAKYGPDTIEIEREKLVVD